MSAAGEVKFLVCETVISVWGVTVCDVEELAWQYIERGVSCGVMVKVGRAFWMVSWWCSCGCAVVKSGSRCLACVSSARWVVGVLYLGGVGGFVCSPVLGQRIGGSGVWVPVCVLCGGCVFAVLVLRGGLCCLGWRDWGVLGAVMSVGWVWLFARGWFPGVAWGVAVCGGFRSG